jgi:hypothetical protein
MSKIIIKKLNEDTTPSTNKTGYKSPYAKLAGVGPRASAVAAVNVPLCVWAKWDARKYLGDEFKGLRFKAWSDTEDSTIQRKQLTKPFYILDYDLFHRCYDKYLLDAVRIHEEKVTLSDIFNVDGSFIKKGVWGAIKEFYNPGDRYYRQKSPICDAICAMVDLWDLVYKQIPAHPDYPVYTYAEAKKVMEKCEEKYWQEEEENKFQNRVWRTNVLSQKRQKRHDQGITGSATRGKALIDHAKKLIQDKTCVQGTIIFVDTVNNSSLVSAKISEGGKITTTPGVPLTTLTTRFIPVYMCMRADYDEDKTDHINYHSLNSELVKQLDLEDELIPESSPPRAGFGITSVDTLTRGAADDEPEFWMTDGFDKWYLETVFVDSKDYSQDPKKDWGNDRRRIIHNDKADYDKSYGWLWDPKQNGLEPPDENNTPDDENK